MTRPRRWLRRLGAQDGQTMVDLALIMPVMVLLVMGVLDFSVAVARTAQLTSAVQEGASHARQYPTATTTIRDHVKLEGSGLHLVDADISVSCYSGLTTTSKACSSATYGDSVRVQATYRYAPLTGRLLAIAQSFGSSTLNIVQSATSEIY